MPQQPISASMSPVCVRWCGVTSAHTGQPSRARGGDEVRGLGASTGARRRAARPPASRARWPWPRARTRPRSAAPRSRPRDRAGPCALTAPPRDVDEVDVLAVDDDHARASALGAEAERTIDHPGIGGAAEPGQLLAGASLVGVEEVLEGGDAPSPHRRQLGEVPLVADDRVQEVVDVRPPIAVREWWRGCSAAAARYAGHEVTERRHPAVERALRLAGHVRAQALRDRGILLARHVHVGIDEPGQHVLPAGIDHSTGRRQGGVGTDRDDPLALDRHAAADHARRASPPGRSGSRDPPSSSLWSVLGPTHPDKSQPPLRPSSPRPPSPLRGEGQGEGPTI